MTRMVVTIRIRISKSCHWNQYFTTIRQTYDTFGINFAVKHQLADGTFVSPLCHCCVIVSVTVV